MSQNDQRRVFVAQAENGKLTDTDILQVLSAAEIDLATVRRSHVRSCCMDRFGVDHMKQVE